MFASCKKIDLARLDVDCNICITIAGVALQNDTSERMRKRSAWRAARAFSAEQLEGIVSAKK